MRYRLVSYFCRLIDLESLDLGLIKKWLRAWQESVLFGTSGSLADVAYRPPHSSSLLRQEKASCMQGWIHFHPITSAFRKPQIQSNGNVL